MATLFLLPPIYHEVFMHMDISHILNTNILHDGLLFPLITFLALGENPAHGEFCFVMIGKTALNDQKVISPQMLGFLQLVLCDNLSCTLNLIFLQNHNSSKSHNHVHRMP